jgi:hypothetical protein
MSPFENNKWAARGKEKHRRGEIPLSNTRWGARARVNPDNRTGLGKWNKPSISVRSTKYGAARIKIGLKSWRRAGCVV